MLTSMTAFSSRQGTAGAHQWIWDMRGVNARGLDLRLRLPEGLPGLEAAVRSAIASRILRGSVTLNLRLSRNDPAAGLALDTAHLDRVLSALTEITDRARAAGLILAQPTAEIGRAHV